MNEKPLELIDDLRLLNAPISLFVLMIIALGVAVLAVGVLMLWRRRQAQLRQQPSQRAAAAALEDALALLEAARRLIKPGNSKPYGVEVSGIVRRYIEVRFDIYAPRRSTEEFLAETQVSPKLEPNHRKLLANFLGCCDLFKFARTHAEPAELTALHDAAVRFVTDTRLIPSATPAAAPTTPLTAQAKEAA
jgi:hypothetical protein